MQEIRRRIRVEGRVQGVGFRAATANQVRRLGHVRGYVRNLPDGSVEAVLIGPEDKVNQAIDWCRRGPLLASVSCVNVEEIPESFEYQGFEILR